MTANTTHATIKITCRRMHPADVEDLKAFLRNTAEIKAVEDYGRKAAADAGGISFFDIVLVLTTEEAIKYACRHVKAWVDEERKGPAFIALNIGPITQRIDRPRPRQTPKKQRILTKNKTTKKRTGTRKTMSKKNDEDHLL